MKTKLVEIKVPRKLLKTKKDFEEAISYHLISTNHKPKKHYIKIPWLVMLDLSAYVISCLAIAGIITLMLIQYF